MSSIKAVIFRVRGVLIFQPENNIATYEKKLGLPVNFLKEIFNDGTANAAFEKLQKGELITSQYFPMLESELKIAAMKKKLFGFKFSAEELFDIMALKQNEINKEMLNAASVLQKKGIMVGAICNNWMDDRDSAKLTQSELFARLRLHFDVVIESSKVGHKLPDKEVFELTMKELKVRSKETLFLDCVDKNCQGAKEIGMKVIKVGSIKQTLGDMSKEIGISFTGLKSNDVIFPLPVTHDRVSHCYAEVQPGIVLHYIDVGTGPVIMLFHGFPELWYSWRYQISALVDTGYRVIAMDTRGYGESSSPHEITAYSQDMICKDAIGLMNRLSISLCTIIGHDWGGVVVWNLALNYPDRVRAVGSVNTPYFCHEGLQKLKDNISIFNYQIYFKEPGVAEKEFEENFEKTFHVMYTNFKSTEIAEQANAEQPTEQSAEQAEKSNKGGLMSAIPDEIKSNLLSSEDVEYFVKNYKKTGFRGPLNYYRNNEMDKLLEVSSAGRKITCPALMVTTSDDLILRPEFSEGMEKEIPRLSRAHIEDCGHWSMFEKPDELSKCFIDWLKKLKL